MRPKEIAEFDQAAKAFVDMIVPLLWGLYGGCLKQGFSAEAALRLTVAYLQKIVTPTSARDQECDGA